MNIAILYGKIHCVRKEVIYTVIGFSDKSADISARFDRIAFNNMARCEAHEKYEFYCLTEGERYIFVKDSFYHVKAGDAFLIAPGVEHRTLDAGGGYARLVMSIPASHFPGGSEPGCELFVARAEGETAKRIVEQTDRIIECAEQDRGGIYAYSLILSLLEMVLSCENIVGGVTVATPTLDRVADILKYIDAHFTENISLINLSERFYLSEFYLCRLFKEYTGRTVLGYLTSLRMNRAKKLLDTTEMPIAKIAKASGFGSVSAFGTAFRSRMDCSPREWRKRGRADA